MVEVDARGYSCPEPAMMAMQACQMYADEEIRVLVSTATQKQNVLEVAEKQGRSAVATQEDNDYVVTIK